MKPEERRKEIMTLLGAMQKELRVDELSEVLKVSGLTIRRDLDQLAQEGVVIRTHGGCTATGRAAVETAYHAKVAQNFALKQAIGRLAAREVNPGDVLLINDGSTTYHLSSHLADRCPLTVYTNSLAMIADLSRCPGLTLYILGGLYNGDLYSLQGSLTEQVLESLMFDACFIGADAVTPEGGCMVDTPEEANLTRAILRRARRRILLADHTKCSGSGHFAYGTLQDYDLWITTPGIAPELHRFYTTLVTIKEAES